MTEDASEPADGATEEAETTASQTDAPPTDAEANDTAAGTDDGSGESPKAEDAEAAETEDNLAARVAAYDEELAAEVESLQRRVSELESELDSSNEEVEDLSSRLKRTQADFQNYKKRAKKKQEQIRERATEDFVERVVKVRDNLIRALEQDEDADIRPGIESTLEEFDRILDSENVSTIDPEPGTDVDPTRHEVMMRVDSDQPEGTVADVYQPGYEMAEKVIREAQITVSTGESDE
ncbi:nucleotide exchange factor GrpE [Halopelagius longus]|uniref:Protein GrpE n=1 Tax=Halopelagius longus TaxID=1236180 RepID=A0A1H1AI62_9EURY|nr:nucleotide exchange factor GrpE [Halopelagius longus]RDI70387.1 nucleotide exchange factor GrpE [Halopelagius longus]SDQ39355.1 molecular chaperone GrpE [Halopelagius longus]